MTRHLATLRAWDGAAFTRARDSILGPGGMRGPPPRPTAVESLNCTRPTGGRRRRGVGLGCGSFIVASRRAVTVPGTLPRPRAPFGGRLVAAGFRTSPQFDGVAGAGAPTSGPEGRPLDPLVRGRVIVTPAVYQRLVEFLRGDIHGTGQKSHCVNTTFWPSQCYVLIRQSDSPCPYQF